MATNEEQKGKNKPTRRAFLAAAASATAASAVMYFAMAYGDRPNDLGKDEERPTQGHAETKRAPIIAIHGGFTSDLHEKRELLKAKHDSLALIVAEAEDYLLGRGKYKKRHSAVDTAKFAVNLLEHNPLFNAGLGAVFQRDGDVRRTASLMGAVPDPKGKRVRYVSAAIEAAPGIPYISDAVYHLFSKLRYHTPAYERVSLSNVRLCGEKATEYVVKNKATIKDEFGHRIELGYTTTQATAKKFLASMEKAAEEEEIARQSKGKGTVGCVVFDGRDYAAATSTGGTASNVPGRTGDSGTTAGNYASAKCAASCTGDGEGIINLDAAGKMDGWLEDHRLTKAVGRLFLKAFREHVSMGMILIGQGKGDKAPTFRATDSDGSMYWAYIDGNERDRRGHSIVHVSTNDAGQYYDKKKRKGELKEAKLDPDEYNSFAKISNIGSPRSAIEPILLTPANRQALEKSVCDIMSKPDNKPIPFTPPDRVKGLDDGPINMPDQMIQSRKAGIEKARQRKH
jgi:L-asparaginase